MTRMWPWAVVIAWLAGACGPSAGVGDAETVGTAASKDGSDGVGSTSAQPGDDTTGGAPATGSMDGGSTAADESATSGSASGCEDHDPEQGCPAGCFEAFAYPPGRFDLDHAGGRKLCVEMGDVHDTGYRSTWWAEIGGEILFLVSFQGCLAHVSAEPAEWHECGAALDEPPLCGLLCAQNVCPGEEDFETLDACVGPAACAPLSYDGGCTPPVDQACTLVALRDRVPGRYEIEFPWPNESWKWLFVVDEDGTVQATVFDIDTISCTSAFTGAWHPAVRCQLAGPALFQTCIEAMSLCGDVPQCHPSPETMSPWLVDCAQMPATCG